MPATPSTEVQIKGWRAPRNREELWHSIVLLTGYRVPRVAVCPGHCAPFDALADAYFRVNELEIWLASRGLAGKTTTLGILAFMEEVALGAQVTVLGGSGEQSRRVHETTTNIWKWPHAPRHMLLGDVAAYKHQLSNGGGSQALTASQRSVRGPHPQRLRMDEVDEMELAIFDAALGQPMAARGILDHIVASSTHQNPVGTMTEVLKRAGKQGWPVRRWCYRETSASGGWLSKAQIEAKRRVIPRAMWQVEYELGEPSPEGRAIDTGAVDRAFDPALGEYAAADTFGQLLVLEDYTPLGSYATGADWAKKRNYTVIATYRTDVHPMRLVAYERRQLEPWPIMIGAYNARVRMYPGVAAHDGTGLGTVVDDYLEVDATPVELVGKRRSEMLTRYIAHLEHGALLHPRIEFAHAEHRYATTNDLFGSGHLPDTICAGAVALWAHDNLSYSQEEVYKVQGAASIAAQMQAQYPT